MERTSVGETDDLVPGKGTFLCSMQGGEKLDSDTQRYVPSTDQGMSSCRSQRYARLILQTSWSKVGLNTSPREAGSRPKGASGQHAMQ